MVYVVALGGTASAHSSTERALAVALAGAAAAGARTLLIAGSALDLPIYAPGRAQRCPAAAHLIAELRLADGVILGSPGYHGGVSGLVKNAIDYIEDMARDPRPYLDGRAVGAIGTGGGWQGAVGALTQLRAIIHALRGWNTPLGVAINTAEPAFDTEGMPLSEGVAAQLRAMGGQVALFRPPRDE